MSHQAQINLLTNVARYYVPKVGGEKFVNEIIQSLDKEFSVYRERFVNKAINNVFDIPVVIWRIYSMRRWCNKGFLNKVLKPSIEKAVKEQGYPLEDTLSPSLAASYLFKKELIRRGW